MAAGFAEPHWVRRRCDHVRAIVRSRVDRLDPTAPVPYQVAEWVLAAGQTTHLLQVLVHLQAVWAVLADLGIASVPDLNRRARQVAASLPAISTVADDLIRLAVQLRAG